MSSLGRRQSITLRLIAISVVAASILALTTGPALAVTRNFNRSVFGANVRGSQWCDAGRIVVQGIVTDTVRNGRKAMSDIDFKPLPLGTTRTERVFAPDGGSVSFRFNSGLQGITIWIGEEAETIRVLDVSNAC